MITSNCRRPQGQHCWSQSNCITTQTGFNQHNFWVYCIKTWYRKTSTLIIIFIMSLQDHSNPFSPPIRSFMWFSNHVFSLFMPPPLSSFYPDYLTILRCYVDRLDLHGIWFQCHWKRHWIYCTTLFFILLCHSFFTCDLFLLVVPLYSIVVYVSFSLIWWFYDRELNQHSTQQTMCNIKPKWPSTLWSHNANMETSILVIDQWRLETRAPIGSLSQCHIALCLRPFSLLLSPLAW